MNTRTIFMISPIGSAGSAEHRRYRQTLDYIVKKAFGEPDWAVVRADEDSAPDSITTQVIGRIVESDLIIADLTDHNPNVFYELAVAHGYQKPVIHLMQSGQTVPFDVVDQRVIFYDLTDPESVDKARKGLQGAATWLDENQSQTRNPLSAYGRFSAISSATESGEGGEAVAQVLQELTRQIARLDRRIGESRIPASRTNDLILNLLSEREHLQSRLDSLRILRTQELAIRVSGSDEHEQEERFDKLEREITSAQRDLTRLDSQIANHMSGDPTR